MTTARRVLAVCWVVGTSAPAFAAPPIVPCQITFYLHEQDGIPRTPISAVSLVDKFFLVAVQARPQTHERHELRMKIYDSNGREAQNGASHVSSTPQGVASIVGYFFKNTDVPGTWWVAVSIDDQLIGSRSIVVK